MDYYKRALELNDETVKNRRYFHTNAETGLHMPMACAYVMDKLTKYGLTPSRCGEGAFEVRRRCDCYCRKWR